MSEGRKRLILRRAEARFKDIKLSDYQKDRTPPDGLLTWREMQATLKGGYPLEEQADAAYDYLANEVADKFNPTDNRFYVLITDNREMNQVVGGLNTMGIKFHLRQLSPCRYPHS
jgi:hypothetical protein